MDGFSHVIGELRRNGYARLKAYVPDGRTRFSTWLVVVTRRLLLDDHRRRYGRSRSDDETPREARLTRRRLEDLVASEIDPEQLATDDDQGADAALRRAELARAIREGLAELRPGDRLLIALRFEDERPVREIAAELGLPTVFHVYRRIASVLAVLRHSLEQRGIRDLEP